MGGGPAGLEVARVLAIRGHEVILIDEGEALGGTLKVSSISDFKKRLERLVRWYEAQLKQLGVRLMTKVKAAPKTLEELRQDAVVIATGSRPLIPKIPGVESAVVTDDVLLGRAPVGRRVIVVGSGLVGVETALHLAMNGRE
ncbi:MAG: FAD-dependent oxidoreductase, partial [Thermofilaceae archaeon]